MGALAEMESFAQIKVVGVGGGGCNAVNRMIREKIRGVQFIAVNTDAQALVRSEAPIRIRIGDKLTKGLGTGGDPNKGMKAAEESREELLEAVKEANMVFITAGMGKGTGTGGAPVIAEIAKETGALTIGVVTKPFSFEGTKRRQAAEDGIARLSERVDTLIIIPNDRLLSTCDRALSIDEAYRVADDVLRQGIQGISEVVTLAGEQNVDFADVRTIMTEAGQALMAVGWGKGENRAVDAANAAISSPLLEVHIDGARGLLFNICGGPNLTLYEVNAAAEIITKAVDPDANIIFGRVTDPRMEDEVKITVIATGFATVDTRVMPADNNIRQLRLHTPADADDLDIPPFLRRAQVMRS